LPLKAGAGVTRSYGGEIGGGEVAVTFERFARDQRSELDFVAASLALREHGAGGDHDLVRGAMGVVVDAIDAGTGRSRARLEPTGIATKWRSQETRYSFALR
jgi:hypothetical protein